jgi:hypothetical protein
MNATIVHAGTPARRHTGQRAASRLGQPTGSLTFLHWSHGTAKPNSNVMIKRLVSLGRHQTFDHDDGGPFRPGIR